MGITIFSWLIRPAIIGAFASPYFMSGTKPFVNIAIVLLWLGSLSMVSMGIA
jgi:hypothetical protein